MKRLYLHFLLILMVLCHPVANAADINGSCGRNLRWSLTPSGVLTITGEGRMNDYSRNNMPWRPVMVKELHLSDSIEYICDNAFNGAQITEAELPAALKEIGKSAFANCSKLAAVSLPYGLTNIGSAAFRNCESLVKIQIPSSVRSIGEEAFAGCRLISRLALSPNIEALGKNAFKDCKSLASVSSVPLFISETNCRSYGIPVAVLKQSRAESPAVAPVVASAEVTSAPAAPSPARSEITAAVEYGESDIDRSVPHTGVESSRTFAFIIANENYAAMPDVPFALNDGRSFASYCQATLGLPKENVNTYFNATYGHIRAAVDYMHQIDEAFRGDVSFIVYYAGHGAPDEASANAYLVPADAHAINGNVCYPLASLFEEFGALKAKSVKVFMDACFSGVDRANDVMAQGSRGVAIAPRATPITGNVVVLSATSNEQAAWHYAPQGHGLFTYCLIKKLQETAGDVSMGELYDYLAQQVPQISIVSNRTTQTPTAIASPSVGKSWRKWQIRR